MAESGPSKSPKFDYLSVRYWKKRTLMRVLPSCSLSTIVPLPNPMLDLFDWPRIICRPLSIMGQSELASTSIEETMRYPVIKPPTRQEQALIRRKIKEVVKAHGGLRAAARHLKIKRSYLSALMDGTKKNPGDWYLRKLGLRRVTYIEEI